MACARGHLRDPREPLKWRSEIISRLTFLSTLVENMNRHLAKTPRSTNGPLMSLKTIFSDKLNFL